MEVGCGAPAKLVPAPAATGRGGGGGGGGNVLDIDKHAVYSPAICFLLLFLFFFFLLAKEYLKTRMIINKNREHKWSSPSNKEVKQLTTL